MAALGLEGARGDVVLLEQQRLGAPSLLGRQALQLLLLPPAEHSIEPLRSNIRIEDSIEPLRSNIRIEDSIGTCLNAYGLYSYGLHASIEHSNRGFDRDLLECRLVQPLEWVVLLDTRDLQVQLWPI